MNCSDSPLTNNTDFLILQLIFRIKLYKQRKSNPFKWKLKGRMSETERDESGMCDQELISSAF